MINSSSSNAGINLFGIDPDIEMNVTELSQALYDSSLVVEKIKILDPELINQFIKDSVGLYFQGVKRNPIFLGEELAKKLKLKVRWGCAYVFDSVPFL